MADEKPTIDVLESAPFLVKGLEKLTDSEGRPVEFPEAAKEKGVLALCRCGQSEDKPFCDGTHKEIGFSGKRERSGEGEAREFAGEEITIVDDAGSCCHAGECVDGAGAVFFSWQGDERIPEPDKDTREAIIAAIRNCPSGALAYKLEGKLHDIYFSEPEIRVSKDGPLEVRGGVGLNNPDGPGPRSGDHYALCRCGASKNKPFCDGSHSKVGFSDENQE